MGIFPKIRARQGRDAARRPAPGRWILLPATAVMALVLSACASSGGGSQTRISSDVITSQELAELDVGNLYEAVQRLRPRWLSVRSTRSVGMENIVGVFQGQSFLGQPDVLRQYRTDSVSGLRYVDAATASNLFPRVPGVHLDGAIVLESR